MGSLYAIYQSRRAPGCLQRANGTVLETAYGAEKDVSMDRARQGVMASLPGYGPPDALPYIGAERKLRRAVGETDDAYAERLRTCFDDPAGPSFCGSDGSILFELARAGFPMGTASGVNIVKRAKTYSYLDAGVVTYGTHAPMSFDGSSPALWNQFMVVIGADFTPPIGFTFEDGDPSADLFNSIIYGWKPSKWVYKGCAVILSAPVWGWPPTRMWDPSGIKWGGGSVRFVSP